MFGKRLELCRHELLVCPQDNPAWRFDKVGSASEKERVIEKVMAAMRGANFPDKEIQRIRLALDEAIVNANKHGNRGDWARSVAVRYHVNPREILAQVEDEGAGFDPEKVPDPLAVENLERDSGRGLYLMRTYMTSVCHNSRGNCVCFCKRGFCGTKPGVKISLVVANTGRSLGTSIPVSAAKFSIGRDQECQLRPANPLVSRRHCNLLVRGHKAFVCDLGSANGTFVNGERVAEERELHNNDRLSVGPLTFVVQIATVPVAEDVEEIGDDTAAAAFLLATQALASRESAGTPTGKYSARTTEIEIQAALPKPHGLKEQAKPTKILVGDTAIAAGAILDRYLRRPRNKTMH
jgi:serine/threonine-protein kinase RsbW